MPEPRKPQSETSETSESQAAPTTEAPRTGSSKTLQELERIQFDALDRAGFER
jgi:hypothetical protein